jgi:hypothetical protein
MIITSRRTEEIYDEVFQRAPSNIKYLGVTIYQKLTFKNHLANFTKKSRAKLAIWVEKLTTKTKLLIYNSIIQPHIDFCSTIIFMGTEEKIRDFQIIQNRAMRLILKKGPRTRVEWMLSTLQMMSVTQKVYLNTLVLIYKMKNNMLPKYMSDEVQLNRQVAEKALRNADDFRLPKYNKSCTLNTMWHNGLKLFNELPPQTKNLTNIEAFKKAVETRSKLKY